jgi:hypothetical protein
MRPTPLQTRSSPRIARVAVTIGAALVCLALAPAALACPHGYAYAGVYAKKPVAGVAAELTMLTRPSLVGGHIAAWVGVGGHGLGPQGTAEWLQVGLASYGRPEGRLYYELKLPGQRPKFVQLAADIEPGQSVRVAIFELPSKPENWIVITPKGIRGPFHLPRSHGRWGPVATSESLAPGGSVCNDYSYRFSNVEVARGGSWQSLRRSAKVQDSGLRVKRESESSFRAYTIPVLGGARRRG